MVVTRAMTKFAGEATKAFVESQTGMLLLGIVAGVTAEASAETLKESLGSLSEPQAEQLLRAFQQADSDFVRCCDDHHLQQAVISKPLAGLESLEALARSLPETFDQAALVGGIRDRIATDWPGAFTPEQLKYAGDLYWERLAPALAAKCKQLWLITYLAVRAVHSAADQTNTTLDERVIPQLTEIKSLLIEPNSLAQLGPPEWVRPTPPRPTRDLVGRLDDLEALTNLLTPGARVAITAAAVQGMPGVGKTLLAEHLAVQLDPHFPAGVLFERLGAGFTDPQLTTPILNAWGAHAYALRPLPEGTQLNPDAVRALLAGHGRLLVVLDDLWSAAAIRPLLDALPPEATLLLTTRSEQVARQLRGRTYPLAVLSKPDALALLRQRVQRSTDADDPLLTRLATTLGRHAQALDIAGASLDRLPRPAWPNAVAAMARQVAEGTGLGEIDLPGDEPHVNAVEAAFAFSYDALPEPARRRFRWLGAFAPDASFRTLAAALMWECQPDEAHGQLTIFAERGLITRVDTDDAEPRWQQHSLLRAYALALLHRQGDELPARAAHASSHLAMMRAADDQQVHYLMLPDYPQLRHAFEWALEGDLGLAANLVANTANLQAGFGLVRDHYEWARGIHTYAAQSGDDDLQAIALGNLANALTRLAGLPGEDRDGRLREALAAYDEALRYRRPDTAPLAYATTQNNRANRLAELAGLPGEDREARLREALAALDEALKHYRPDTAPLAYAMTQGNRTAVLRALSSLPGEDRAGRLREALGCALTAYTMFDAYQHASYRERARAVLGEMVEQLGEEAAVLWEEAEAEATANLDRAIAVRPDFPEILARRAAAYLQAGLYSQALATFDRALALQPENAVAWAGRAEVHRLAGRPDEAIANFDRALEHQPDLAWALASRGQAQRALGHRDAALADLDRALQLDDTMDWARVEQAQVLDELDRPQDALLALSAALKRQPDYPTALATRADILQKLSRYQEAEADYRRLIELDPDSPFHHNNLGSVYMDWGRLDDAKQQFSIRIQMRPEDALNANSSLGQIAWRQQDEAEARRAFEQALAVWDTAAEEDLQPPFALLEHKVIAFLCLGRPAEALQALDAAEAAWDGLAKPSLDDFRALTSGPRVPEALDEVIRRLEQLGNRSST